VYRVSRSREILIQVTFFSKEKNRDLHAQNIFKITKDPKENLVNIEKEINTSKGKRHFLRNPRVIQGRITAKG
jgi:hypothetical protein